MLQGVKSPVQRAIAQALISTGSGAAIMGGAQAGSNIVTGEPIGQGVPGAIASRRNHGRGHGAAHGVGELRRPAEEVPTAVPPLPRSIRLRRWVKRRRLHHHRRPGQQAGRCMGQPQKRWPREEKKRLGKQMFHLYRLHQLLKKPSRSLRNRNRALYLRLRRCRLQLMNLQLEQHGFAS